MDDDRTAKQQPTRSNDRDQQQLRTAGEPRRGDSERKPTPIEPREWRGSGVCGDRHTD